MSLRSMILISTVLALPACATTADHPVSQFPTRTVPEELFCPYIPDDGIVYQDHVIVVDQKGNYHPSLAPDDPGAPSFPPTKTFRSQFKKIVDGQEQYRREKEAQGDFDAAKRILLYVNGGLQSRAESLRLAKEQVHCIKKAGYFPIFLIWDSSGPESYWEQISQVRGGILQEDVLLTTPLYFFGDIVQGLGRAPAYWSKQFGDWVQSLLEARDNIPVILDAGNGLRVQYRGPDQDDSDLNLNSFFAVLSKPVKMVTTPFVDAIGKTAWENMVRHTRRTMHHPGEFVPMHWKDIHSGFQDMDRYPRGTGTFAKFFGELEGCTLPPGQRQIYTIQQSICIEDNIGQLLQDVEITAIGHSMGTIVLNEVMRRFPNLPFRNIVYMASAASIRDTLFSVIPLLRRDIVKEQSALASGQTHMPIRFYNLSLNPVAEDFERAAFNLVPDGSLLVWIDDMYVSKAFVTERTFGRWRNIEKVARFIPSDVRPRMFFKIFGFRKPVLRNWDPGDPVVHGAFNDTIMHYWLKDYWWSP